MERNEENGKKLQQSGGAGSVSGAVSGEEYTHGGVKKTKFEPKVPTRRLKKLSASVKSEPGEGLVGGLRGGEVPKELQRLLQQVDSDGRGRDRASQRTSKVAFGFSGFNSRSSGSSSGFQHRGSAGVGKAGGGSVSGSGDSGVSRSGVSGVSGSGVRGVSGSGVSRVSGSGVSRVSGSGVSGVSGSGAVGGGNGGVVSRVVEKQEFMQADEMHIVESKKGERKSVGVFDHEKYYPVTLPLRKPLGRDESRLLDEEEFGEGEDVQEEDENGMEAARELGLTESKDEDTLFFFQFPRGLPLSLNPLSSKESEKKASSRSVKLEDLGKGGIMGKLLVYESGAVKFKIGDVILDALPGTECTFAQEVAAVNTTTKRCGFIGEVHKRVVLTPDITDVLPDLTDLRTKP